MLGLGITFNFGKLDALLSRIEGQSLSEVVKDERFWAGVRAGYRLKPDYINLENGYYCITPQETLENLVHHVREVNYHGSWYMRTVRRKNKDYIASQLAKLIGCAPEEVIITRNTTESLDTIIGGFAWKEGDEAVMADQDYGAMRNMFKLQERRHGIVVRSVSVPNHPRSDDEIVDLYAKAITAKTRLLMVCHMINITGQILPIRKICDMAHAKGVEVMVDGAHTFGHIDFSIRDLDCDYYGSSLHKWLSAPLGAGLLYVRNGLVPNIWETFADFGKEVDDIRRLNHTGTHPVHTDLAIGNAIEYLERLGLDRKEARLRYLQNYWAQKVRHRSNIILNTPEDPSRSCAIANVGIRNIKPSELAKTLLEKYRIWTVAIDGQGVHGCRITPNIYTSITELDALVEALIELSL